MKRIIIADDSSLARMFTARCLTVGGFSNFTIEEAKDGLEVYALLSEEKYDLIITDLNMPEMDGMELLDRISKEPTMNTTPVIVITSAGNAEERTRLKDLGAKAILSKPITPADLAKVVEPYLDKGESYYE